MNPGGPILRLSYTDDTARYQCMTCGAVYEGPRAGSPPCPHCAGPVRRFPQVLARIRRMIDRTKRIKGGVENAC